MPDETIDSKYTSAVGKWITGEEAARKSRHLTSSKPTMVGSRTTPISPARYMKRLQTPFVLFRIESSANFITAGELTVRRSRDCGLQMSNRYPGIMVKRASNCDHKPHGAQKLAVHLRAGAPILQQKPPKLAFCEASPWKLERFHIQVCRTDLVCMWNTYLACFFYIRHYHNF